MLSIIERARRYIAKCPGGIQGQDGSGATFHVACLLVHGFALSEIDARQLTNIRLHHGDALDVLAWLPPASLARVDLIYPDPWPKRRHWKRRFVQDTSLAELARVLRGGGEFRFVTDIPDYAAWTLDLITFVPTTSAPTGLACTNPGGAQSYVLTAVNDESGEESLASAAVGAADAVSGVVFTPDAPLGSGPDTH